MDLVVSMPFHYAHGQAMCIVFYRSACNQGVVFFANIILKVTGQLAYRLHTNTLTCHLLPAKVSLLSSQHAAVFLGC